MNTFYFATTEYGAIIPETIRQTEKEAIDALVKWAHGAGIFREDPFSGGVRLARVSGFGTLFEARGEVEYLRGFRTAKVLSNPTFGTVEKG